MDSRALQLGILIADFCEQPYSAPFDPFKFDLFTNTMKNGEGRCMNAEV